MSLPSWPKRESLDTASIDAWPQEIAYERAMKEAYAARLRLAVEALKIAEQARSEVRHAKEVGPNWYTRGERGMHAQVLMWDGKAGEAVAKALAAIGEVPQG